jgi:hypothetical protein
LLLHVLLFNTPFASDLPSSFHSERSEESALAVAVALAFAFAFLSVIPAGDLLL